MPNQYTKLTRENILRKMNRQRNPVRSIAQLAREFGTNTTYMRYLDGTHGTAAPGAFRTKVKALVGQSVYNALRDDSCVNRSYR